MAMVVAKPGESFESMYRRFKKKVVRDEIIPELRKREYYVSPSQKRRLKKEAAIKRARKKG